MKYKVRWQHIKTQVQGEGKVFESDPLALDFIQSLNKTYPNLFHWLEIVDEKNKEGDS